MTRSIHSAHIYGYSVCLVAFLTVLISAGLAVYAAIGYFAPITDARFGEDLASFEGFRETYLRRLSESRAPMVPQDDATIRKIYEARRKSAQDELHFEEVRNLAVNLALIVISVGLIIFHWRWLKSLPKTE